MHGLVWNTSPNEGALQRNVRLVHQIENTYFKVEFNDKFNRLIVLLIGNPGVISKGLERDRNVTLYDYGPAAGNGED